MVVVKSAATKDTSAVGSADWVRLQAEIMLNGRDSEYPYAYVREVFPDRIVIDAGIDNLVEIPYSVTDDALTLSTDAATQVKLVYVPKSESPVLTGPIIYKAEDDELRVAYAAVLVPGEPDSDGDVVSANKIQEVAHTFLETYRNIDLMHTLAPADATVVESYITPADMEVGEYTLPAGTWVMAAKFLDDNVWAAIKDGTLTGYSIMGVRKAALKAAMKGEASFKRTLLSDLGDDWVVPFVSVVDAPAVPKAKFFALKSAGQRNGSWLSRLIFGTDDPAIKVGRKFSEATYTRMKDAHGALGDLIDEAEKERKDKTDAKDDASKAEKSEGMDMTPEQLQEALGAALNPLTERLTALETALAKPADAAEDDDGDEADKAADADVEALRAEVAQLTETLQEVEKRLPVAKSRAIRAQDTDSDSDEKHVVKGAEYERDMFGRRRSKPNTAA